MIGVGCYVHYVYTDRAGSDWRGLLRALRLHSIEQVVIGVGCYVHYVYTDRAGSDWRGLLRALRLYRQSR